MHLLVLSAFRLVRDDVEQRIAGLSQCTFWCSVLSDSGNVRATRAFAARVSMHLLVLSAFRRKELLS